MSKKGWFGRDSEAKGEARKASKPPTQGSADGPGPAAGASATGDVAVLAQLVETQRRTALALEEGANQNAFLRALVGQVSASLKLLHESVSAQSLQSRDGERAVLTELGKFQAAGPQRQLAGVFSKLMRDLLKPLTQLDEVLAHAAEAAPVAGGASGGSWLEAVRVTRDGFETVLKDWGCTSIPIALGKDEFNPEIHEAAPGEGSHGSSAGTNRVVAVRRRGWVFAGAVLQHPLVVVG